MSEMQTEEKKQGIGIVVRLLRGRQVRRPLNRPPGDPTLPGSAQIGLR